MSPDEVSRLGCTTSQYDQVIAISEEMITKQLKTYSEWVPGMQTFKLSNYILGSMEGELTPPRVTIPNGQGTNQTLVRFHLGFVKGSLKYRNMDLNFITSEEDEKNMWTTKSLAGSEIAFFVNLGMENVKKEEKPAISSMLRVAGDYSIQRLALMFGTSNCTQWDEAHTKLPWPEDNDERKLMKAALDAWIKELLIPFDQAENRLRGFKVYQGKKMDFKCTVLYHALAEDPAKVNPLAPNFPPTVVCHQTYNFRTPSKAVPDSTERNCLLYLEMCNKAKELPNKVFYDYSGNYVTSDRQRDAPGKKDVLGSMCLSSRILVESHMLKFFRPLIKLLEFTVKTANPDNMTWVYAFNDNPKHPTFDDSYFLMKRQQGKDELLDSTLKWFNDEPLTMRNEKGWRWVNELQDFKPKIKDKIMSVQGRSLVNLTYATGKNVMTLKGWTTINVSPQSASYEHELAITAWWSVNLIFKSGDRGRLEIEIQWNKNGDSFVQFSEWYRLNGQNQVWGGEKGALKSRGGYPAQIMTKLEEDLESNINCIISYVDNLKSILSNQAFVLAGAGYFNFKNPVFSENGDLLVELEYDGISPEKSLDSSIGEQAKDKQQLKNGSVTANPIPDMINEGGKSRTIKLDL